MNSIYFPSGTEKLAGSAGLNTVGTITQCRNVASMTAQVGGVSVAALSEFMAKHRLDSALGDLNTFGGAGLGAAAARNSAFLMALSDYDSALSRYQDLKNHRGKGRTLHAAKLAVERTQQALALRFHHEWTAILARYQSRSQLTSTNTGKQAFKSVPILNTQSTANLKRFASVARVAGPGVILLDGGLRARSVHQMHQAGDPNWKREAFAQSAGFGVAIGTGIALAKVGASVIALTPWGLVIGLTVIGVTAIMLDKSATELARRAYNRAY